MWFARLAVVRLVLALVVAANLLHAPSLALGSGNAGADCAAAMTDAHDHHSGMAGDGDRQDRLPGVSACPFANASAPLVAVPDATRIRFSVSRLLLEPGETLVAADLDAEDPPPRALS